MILKEWQQENKINNKELSRILGIDESHVSYINNGHRRPSPELARKIEQVTMGRVTLVELLFPDKHQAA
jgi:DNA-binding transcriptional regulator YdaS (Cro superfamily)